MESKTERGRRMYIARDGNSNLYAYRKKPIYNGQDKLYKSVDGNITRLRADEFPLVRTHTCLTIKLTAKELRDLEDPELVNCLTGWNETPDRDGSQNDAKEQAKRKKELEREYENGYRGGYKIGYDSGRVAMSDYSVHVIDEAKEKNQKIGYDKGFSEANDKAKADIAMLSELIVGYEKQIKDLRDAISVLQNSLRQAEKPVLTFSVQDVQGVERKVHEASFKYGYEKGVEHGRAQSVKTPKPYDPNPELEATVRDLTERLKDAGKEISRLNTELNDPTKYVDDEFSMRLYGDGGDDLIIIKKNGVNFLITDNTFKQLKDLLIK